MPAESRSISMFCLFKLAGSSMAWFILACGRNLLTPCGKAGNRWRRTGMTLLLMPLFLAYQIITWIAHLLDEVFFRGYRAVPVFRPVFILGIPRCGTTLLHRTLARDEDTFTTMRTWEAFLAPAIIQKKAFALLARIDRTLGCPAGRLFGRLEKRLSARMEAIHTLSLASPEEDFITLLPAMACFAMIAVFPADPHLWRLCRFDDRMPPARRRRLLAFYHACLQKHLYVAGAGRTLLSKNASFMSWSRSLRETFPDAHFIGCSRPPEESVPSQLSALEPAMSLFGNNARDPVFARRILEMLVDTYRRLGHESEKSAEPNWTVITMDALKQDLDTCVQQIYQSCRLSLPATASQRLVTAAAYSRRHQSRHGYSLDAFGWTAAEVARQFRDSAIPRPMATGCRLATNREVS